jgi:Ca2+-binding RTX toxin-like protein
VSQTGFYPGIELTSANGNQDPLTWNLEGNLISGKLATMSQAGIYLSATDAGSVHADVDNNSVWDVGQGVTQGQHGGIVLFARDSGNVEFNLVGNTLDKIQGRGVDAENEQHSPSTFGIDLFDDIVANTSGPAVNLVNDPGTTGPYVLRGGHNDLFANHQPNQLLGGNIGQHFTAMPQFVDGPTGNLQLKPTSPLIDQGDTCSPGGVAGPDAAGRDRLHGPSVDVGAFEFGAGPPGVVEAGTNGPDTFFDGPRPDILCGYSGDDDLFGTNGADYVDGGYGNDHLSGGPGPDRLYGDQGNDVLCGNDGAGGDYLNGGPGTDSYRADPGDTKVSVEKVANCHVA